MPEQNHDPRPISPFDVFPKDKKVVESPFIFLDKQSNDSDVFAITKFTDNGKYVKGGMLYYKMFDVEIFADIEATIYVNLIDRSYTVKLNKSNNSVAPVDAETQQYVIMLSPVDDGEEYVWRSIEGRQNCYELIKQEIVGYLYDPDKSFVLTGTVSLNDALSISEFVNYLKNSNFDFANDDFEIEQYKVNQEYDENEGE